MAFENEKEQLQREIEEKTKRLAKLNKVRDQFDEEPEPGSVVKFSRKLAGSPLTYTFVAYRAESARTPGCRDRWYFTGRANALRLLGVTDKGNSWEQVLLAIGDAEAFVSNAWWSAASKEFANLYEAYLVPVGTRLQDKDGDVVEKVGDDQWVYTRLFGTQPHSQNPWSTADGDTGYGPYTRVS